MVAPTHIGLIDNIHISNVDAKLAKYYMMHDLTLLSVIRNMHLLFLSDTCNATTTAVVSHCADVAAIDAVGGRTKNNATHKYCKRPSAMLTNTALFHFLTSKLPLPSSRALSRYDYA